MEIILVQEPIQILIPIRTTITIHHHLAIIVTLPLPDLKRSLLLQEVIQIIAHREQIVLVHQAIVEVDTTLAEAEDHLPVEDDKINTNLFTYVLTTRSEHRYFFEK